MMGGGQLKFYLRLPIKIVDEQQIKSLHPGILVVTLPRQKSRRWCYIELADESSLTELRKVRIEGKRLTVRNRLKH